MTDTDLPPSAKFILKELRAADHGLTTPQLAARTDLPDRTVRRALRRLRERDRIETRRPSPSNPVAPIHRLTE